MDDEILRQSREAGFAAHLTKPIDFPTLEAAIYRAVGASASRLASSCITHQAELSSEPRYEPRDIARLETKAVRRDCSAATQRRR